MHTYDIAIVGAGVMGAATACQAAGSRATVALIDQARLPNPRAASTDYSKVFRFSYPDPLYVRMAIDARQGWLTLEQETGARLLTPTGILLVGSRRPSFETETYDTLRSMGLEAELLDSREAAERFPQFDGGAFTHAAFDPSGAILHAESAVRAFVELARARGVDVFEGDQIASIKQDSRGRVVLASEAGKQFTSECALIASGPWTRKLLPELAPRLFTTKQDTAYFVPPGQDKGHDSTAFDIGRFPIFIALETGFYGFPVHHAGAIKIANHFKGRPIDPYSSDASVGDEFINECRAFFARYLPALARARVQQTRVCIYNNTPDDDFIIDWHPEYENVLVVTGFSGHGFKFAPTIGRIGAELLISGAASFNIDRFRLARFARVEEIDQ